MTRAVCLYYLHFFAVTIAVFLVLASLLVVIGFFPETQTQAKTTPLASSQTAYASGAPLITSSADVVKKVDANESIIPVRVVVSSVGIDSTITSPTSADIDLLNRALLQGVVQYPASGEAGQVGNMLLFGHSSYLPVVKNKAFQAFNELGKVQEGSMLAVYSTTHLYHYRVRSVRLTKAQDAVIQFATEESLVTLVSCNTFGQKQDRWVVEAVFVDKELLPL